MKSEEELKKFYESKLKFLLEPLELYRLDKLKKAKQCLIVTLVGIPLILAGIYENNPILIIISVLLIFYLLCYAAFVFSSMAKQLRKEFKYSILPKLLDFLFYDYQYIARQRFAKSVLEKSLLFQDKIAGVQGEDFMSFKIGETTIMIAEMKVLSNSEEEKFNGMFISATFNKYFQSKTFIYSRSRFNLYDSYLIPLIKQFDLVKLEDANFEKEFIVLSSDQVEARYILTTSLMERILNYKRKINKKMSFSFVENRLYCAVPKFINLFEPALFEPFDLEFVKRNYTPLKIYTDLVEDLNLNLRIWTKE